MEDIYQQHWVTGSSTHSFSSFSSFSLSTTAAGRSGHSRQHNGGSGVANVGWKKGGESGVHRGLRVCTVGQFELPLGARQSHAGRVLRLRTLSPSGHAAVLLVCCSAGHESASPDRIRVVVFDQPRAHPWCAGGVRVPTVPRGTAHHHENVCLCRNVVFYLHRRCLDQHFVRLCGALVVREKLVLCVCMLVVLVRCKLSIERYAWIYIEICKDRLGSLWASRFYENFFLYGYFMVYFA